MKQLYRISSLIAANITIVVVLVTALALLIPSSFDWIFAMFPLAAVPGAIFSTWHNFSGSIAASVFRKLNPSVK